MKKLLLSIGFVAVFSLAIGVADGNSSFSFQVTRTEWNQSTGVKDSIIQQYFTNAKLNLVKVTSHFEAIARGDSIFIAPAPGKKRTVNATSTESWSELTAIVYSEGAQWFLIKREPDGWYSRSPFQSDGFDATRVELVSPIDVKSQLTMGSGVDQQVFNSASSLFKYSGPWLVNDSQRTRLPRGWEWKLGSNYTAYFFDAKYATGMKVEVGLTPKFEKDLITQYPGFQLTTAQIRPTLMAYFYGLTTVQSVPAAFTINAQLLGRLVSNDKDDKNAKIAFTAFKKHLWLALGVTGTKNDPLLEFPPARILEPTNNPGYAKLFYQFARELRMNPIRNAPYSNWDASSLKNQVLQFLVGIEGVEDSTNATVTAYKNWLTSAPTATFHDFSGVDFVSENPQATGPGGSTLRISFPPAATLSSRVVVVPSSPNLMTPEKVLDFSGIAAYVRPRAGSETNYSTSGTLDITMKAATDVRSMVVWADKATLVTISTKNHQGVWTPLVYTEKFVEQDSLTGGIKLLTESTQKFPTRSIELNSTIRASNFRLSFTGGKLFSMRMYPDPNSFQYSSKGDSSSLLVTPKGANRFTTAEAEVFWNGDETASLPSIEPYFVELYGDQFYPRRPGNEFEFDGFHDLYHPIRYSRFGLESPWSYNRKVYNNGQWSTGTGRFTPFTELDLRKGSRLGDDWTYSLMNPPQYPTGKSENDAYPYTYGFTPANKDGTSWQTAAPFFVEKVAGVDSPGLLLSTLLLLGDSTFDLSNAVNRWAGRTTLKSTKEVLANPSLGAVGESLVIDQRWIETHSSVVTNPSEIQVGDLLVGWEGAELSIGIIVRLTTPLTTNTTLSELMKSIQVVTINKPLQRAVLSTWGGFTLDPGQYHIRKLHNTVAPRAIPWVVFQRSLDNLTYQFSRPQEDGVNWIPNTGELHSLGRIQVTTPNQDRIDGVPWSVASVIDPNFVVGAQDGNIRNNTASNPSVFYLVALNRPHRETGIKISDDLQSLISEASITSSPSLVGVSKFTRKTDGTYDPESLLPKNSRFELKVQDNQLAVVSTTLETADAMVYDYFALVATSPHPGDDIQIQFAVDGTMTGSPPRLAIYDKKLLWRANLYIDEGDGGADWNDRHPWVTDNEWNRYYDGTQAENNLSNLPTVTAANAPAGIIPGGQVVRFNAQGGFTPFRNINNGNAAGAVTGSVSYDYVRPTIRAWDSPFDFVWKMRSQRLALRNHFNGTPANVSGQAGVFPNENGGNIIVPNGSPTNDALRNWQNTTSPNNSWKFYWKTASGGNTAYIPGLGYWLEFRSNTHTNSSALAAESLATLNAINFGNDPTSAGADCIGFVQRTASYRNNSYEWRNVGFDRAEGVVNPDLPARDLDYPLDAGTPGVGDCADVIVQWSDVNNNAALRPIGYYNNIATQEGDADIPTIAEIDRLKSLVRRVQTGDIISYPTLAPVNGAARPNTYGAHIGLICKVDYVALDAATTIQALFASIQIIESVANSKLFFIFKRNMNQGPEERNLVDKNDWNNWYLQANLDNGGRYRAWSIQRLRTE